MKRTIYKNLLLAAAVPAMMLVASCSQNDMEENSPGTPNSGGDIRFEINFAPQTRVATDLNFKSTWKANDQIGLFAVKHASGTTATLNPSDNFIQNVKLTCKDASGQTWIASEELWWPDSSSKVDFYAYYPYNANATDPTNIAFSVLTDQKSWVNGSPNYNRSELLTAKADNNGQGYGKGETVSLTFSHALAMVQVNVPTQGKGAGPGETMIVTLNGVKVKSKLNLGAENGPKVELVEENNPKENIKMYRVEIEGDKNYYSSYTYRALIPVQDIPASDNLFLIDNENKLYKGSGPDTELLLKAGTAEVFTRSIPNTLHTVEIKAGTFLMGSPEDEPGRKDNEQQHKVTLTKDFRMSKYNITTAQYAEFLNAIGLEEGEINSPTTNQILLSFDEKGNWGVVFKNGKWVPGAYGPDYPMLLVTWHGANEYAIWAGGSLPTEAQWEYACRAGTTTAYSCPDYDHNNIIDEEDLIYYAWYDKTSRGTIHKIGSLEPTQWGLYDIHGNVSEWCSDRYEFNYGLTPEELKNGVIDPVGPPEEPNVVTDHVIRGGNYHNGASLCRSAYRDFRHYFEDNYSIGFRVVFNQ